jgi:hypothetical protein
MTAILKVDTIQDTSGNNIINENANTITIGKSGDTVNVVGTLQNDGAALVTGKVLQVVNCNRFYSKNYNFNFICNSIKYFISLYNAISCI